MRIDVRGRVRNVTLPATKPLLPLYEAIVNSVQAIEDAKEKQGRIEVTVLRDMQHLFREQDRALGAIVGFTELSILEAPDASQLKHHLQQVMTAGIRATSMVKHILTFSRQTEQERKLVNISPIIKEALKLLRASLPSTIEIKREIPSKTPNLMADPTEIHQIVMNLCHSSCV